jgi:DNA-binding beta-propeller fold protein YncE
MLGIDAYELWEMELRSGTETSTPHLQLLRSVPMTWEPSYPDIDSDKGLLIQSYLSAGVETTAGRGIEQPLIQRIDLESLESIDSWSVGPEVEEMSEFVKVHPVTNDYYVPGFFDVFRFAIVEVDDESLSLKRHKETFHPTIALGFDASGQRMFVTNSLGGTLEQYDLASFERTAVVGSGSFPRDLVVDPARQRVFVGNYSDGTVVEFDVSGSSPVRTKSTEVGSLLRGITIHQKTGIVYAASSCGIFEINPETG